MTLSQNFISVTLKQGPNKSVALAEQGIPACDFIQHMEWFTFLSQYATPQEKEVFRKA